jgi:hypothetical protein
MLVIVGHGPSILSGLGSVIDSHTVVRLKQGLTNQQRKDSKNWGTRTDYISARCPGFEQPGVGYWHFNDPVKWVTYYRQFTRRKPSTGLCAVFCAIDHLNPSDIAVIGFDRILRPHDECTGKWHEPRRFSKFGGGAHDQQIEHECLHSLGVRIIDLSKEYAQKEAEAEAEA